MGSCCVRLRVAKSLTRSKLCFGFWLVHWISYRLWLAKLISLGLVPQFFLENQFKPVSEAYDVSCVSVVKAWSCKLLEWLWCKLIKVPVTSGEFRWCNCGSWKLLCSLSYHSTPVWACSSRRNLTSSASIWALQWRIPSCQLWAGHGTTCTSSSCTYIRALLL